MIDKMPAPSWKKQIRNLLGVLFGGIVVACALSAYLLYYYGPTGTYTAKNTLVSVPTMEKLKISGIVLFVSKGVVNVPFDDYSRFYNSVSTDRSIPSEEAASYFTNQLTTLMLFKAGTPQQVFQQIDFSPEGDHYRVQLLEHNADESYAYFKHPGILKDVKNIMNQP